jgi:hypothetical protein
MNKPNRKPNPYSIDNTPNYKVDKLKDLKKKVVSGYNDIHNLTKEQPNDVNKNYTEYDDIMKDFARKNFPDHPLLNELLETPPVKSENPKKRQNNPYKSSTSKKPRLPLTSDDAKWSDPNREDLNVASNAQNVPDDYSFGGKSRRRRVRRRKTNKKKTRKAKKKTNKKKRKGNKKRKTRSRTRRKH